MIVDKKELEKLIDKLRSENLPFVQNKNFSGIRKVVTDQYVDSAHFILEILQNADDAEATKVSFKLYSDRLLVTNNGRPFCLKDIDSICQFGASTKSDRPNKIGKFGIGFKSVYRYTDSPEIYSVNVAIRICDLCVPEFCESLPDTGDETIIQIPFTKNDAYEDIQEKLDKLWTSDVLLFLQYIEQINVTIYETEDVVNNYILEKKVIPDLDFPWVELVQLVYGTMEKKEYLRCKREHIRLPAKDPDSGGEIERPYSFMIAYRLGKKGIVPISETDDAENNLYFVTFPTKIRHGFEYLIHAPFETERSRETLHEKSKANTILYSAIPQLVIQSLAYLREKKLLTPDFYENVLLRAQDIGKEITLEYVKNALSGRLRCGDKLLPTFSGDYTFVEKLLIFQQTTQSETEHQSVCKLFSPAEIGENIPEFSGVEYWDARYGDKLQRILGEMSCKRINFNQILPKLTAEWLESKSTNGIQQLYRIIAPPESGTGYCPISSPYVSEKYNYSYQWEQPLKSYPLIRKNDGKHVSAASEKLYLNNGSIHSELTSESYSRDFLIRILEVKEYDERQHKIERFDKILAKYRDYSPQISFQENINDLEELLELSRELKYVSIDKIESVKLIHAVGTDGTGGRWCKASDVYLTELGGGEKDTEILLSGVRGVYFIDPGYFQQKNCVISFEKFGVRKNIQPHPSAISPFRKGEEGFIQREPYLQEQASYSKYIREAKSCRGLSNEIDHLSDILDTMTREKSVVLYRYIQRHSLENLRGDIQCSDNKQFPIDGTFEKRVFSKIGWELHNTRWLFGKDGEFHVPKSVRIDELVEDYANISQELLEELGVLGILSDPITKAIEEMSEDDRELLDDMTFLKSIPRDERREMIDKLKNSPKASKMTNTPREALRQHDIPESLFSADDGGDDEDEPRSRVRNPNNYSKNVEDEVREKRNEQPKTYTSVTTKYDNSEENTFLENEYNGKCQICGKMIPRRSGNGHVFVAHKLTKNLAPEYQATRETGWDSLCLCPNCDAELKNCNNNVAETLLTQMRDDYQNTQAEIPVNIQVRNESRRLTYSQRHYLRLQAVMKAFDEEQE